MNTIKLSAAVCINKGNIRDNNEDNFYFDGKYLNANNRDKAATLKSELTQDVGIYGVFDGMGGEALGEEASYIAADTLKKAHKKILTNPHSDREQIILSAIKDANVKICKKIVESGEKRIGTTFTAIKIENDVAKIYNVGDSRAYIFRDGKLSQISEDDTSAQRLVNLGVITKEKSKNHPDKHKLTQHLGIFPNEMLIEPHISREIKLKKSDKLLLCSDGLTDMVDDEDISEILKQSKKCSDLAKELIKKALENGGKDNVTALVLNVESNPKGNIIPTRNKLLITVLAFAICALIASFFVFNRSKENLEPETPKEIIATNIYFTNSSDEIKLGADDYFYIGYEPNNITNKDIKITSSDSSVIEIIDETSGHYKALSVGQAEITAKLNNCEVKKVVTVYSSNQKDEQSSKNTNSSQTQNTSKQYKKSETKTEYNSPNNAADAQQNDVQIESQLAIESKNSEDEIETKKENNSVNNSTSDVQQNFQ